MTTDNTIMFPASKHFPDPETETFTGNPEQLQLLISNINTSMFLIRGLNSGDINYERRMERARKEHKHYQAILQKWNKDATKTYIKLQE